MSLSIATDTCHLSLPSIFTSKPHYLHLSLSFPRRPPSFNLRLVHSLSLKPPKTTKTLFSSFVTKTSNWAQQEEDTDTTFTVAADSEQQQQWGSENESEGGDSNWVSQEEAVAAGGEEFDGEEPPKDAKIYVGNLPYDVDSEKLAMLFEQAGTVEIAEVIYNRETDRSRGFGFVSMRTVEEAEKAVHMFHRYDLDGRLLVVNKAAPRGSRLERTPPVYEQAYRIYVGNLPWAVDDARLEQIFSEHGKVVDARVVSDRETGRSRGFGFITMSTEIEQNDAIAALDGRSLDGRTIRVNVAEQRQRWN